MNELINKKTALELSIFRPEKIKTFPCPFFLNFIHFDTAAMLNNDFRLKNFRLDLVNLN